MGKILSHNAENIDWPIKAQVLINDVEQNVAVVSSASFQGYEITVESRPFSDIRIRTIYGVKNRESHKS